MVDDTWRNFELSGKVSDYLAYRQRSGKTESGSDVDHSDAVSYTHLTDVVVSITDNAVDVVLDMGDVTDAKRAQIEDIVKRKTNINAENIIITPIEMCIRDRVWD